MKKFRKILALMLAAALLFALAGCGAEKEPQEETPAADSLSRITQAGKITVALEGDWAPWSFHDTDSDKVIGFDADVARAIAAKLGVEAEIIEAPWESLFAGLDSGRYDLVINGVEITEEREEKYDFSVPYGYIHTALIVKTDNKEIKTFEDLKGKSTVNSLGSTYMELAEQYGASAAGVSTLAETLTQVLQGRVDATLNADVSFYDYMNQHPDAALKIACVTDEASSVAIPMRKGDDDAALRDAVNSAVAALLEDGTIAELSQTYFGSDITMK